MTMVYPDLVKNNIVYYNAFSGRFSISGFPWLEENKSLARLPESKLDQLPEPIRYLSHHTAGGSIRFVTDSSVLAVKVRLSSSGDMSHMPRSGSSGLDFYIGSGTDKKFFGMAMPELGRSEYEKVFLGLNKEMREWTLHLPLYNGIEELLIGLDPDASLKTPNPRAVEKPVVFYGSSITQGACASRPGNAYSHILGRWLDADVVNLGFNGNAKGEPELAEIIATIDASAFVMDYDYNAPDADHLAATHERFFKIIREAKPTLPVIFITKPDVDVDPVNSPIRRDFIFGTYKKAMNSGDKNVYFIDGETLFGHQDRDACTVDGCHPNDLGFMRMATHIYPVIKEVLHRKQPDTKE